MVLHAGVLFLGGTAPFWCPASHLFVLHGIGREVSVDKGAIFGLGKNFLYLSDDTT